ncbi:MAG: SAM-dependent chlorinase/fluorinase, partial [Gammaproteobacteria bacterium]
MIVLFTDYGPAGPYTGQIKGVFFKHAPGARIADLIADAPRNNPKASAYLLAAFAEEFPIQTVFFTVVDPGVGGGADKPVIMKIDGRWFVGPDNGLFDIVARHGSEIESWQITWKPER